MNKSAALFVIVCFLSLMPLTARANCCSYGCCDCGCIARSPEEIKKRSDAITADINKILRIHNVAGYVSEYRVNLIEDLDTKTTPSLSPDGCRYICTDNEDSVSCKAACN